MPFGALKLVQMPRQYRHQMACTAGGKEPNALRGIETVYVCASGVRSPSYVQVEKNLMPFGALKPMMRLPPAESYEIQPSDLVVEKNLMPFGALKLVQLHAPLTRPEVDEWKRT